MTLPQSLQPSELIQEASKAELQSAFHPHHLPLLTPLGVASTYQASAKPEISGTAFKSLTTPMSRALLSESQRHQLFGCKPGLSARTQRQGFHEWNVLVDYTVSILGTQYGSIVIKAIVPICLFVFHRSKVLRALNLSLPVWWSSPNSKQTLLSCDQDFAV